MSSVESCMVILRSSLQVGAGDRVGGEYFEKRSTGLRLGPSKLLDAKEAPGIGFGDSSERTVHAHLRAVAAQRRQFARNPVPDVDHERRQRSNGAEGVRY